MRCDVIMVPSFSLVFLGMWNFWGATGMCRWWTTRGDECLRFMLLPMSPVSLSRPPWRSSRPAWAHITSWPWWPLLKTAAVADALLRGRTASLGGGRPSFIASRGHTSLLRPVTAFRSTNTSTLWLPCSETPKPASARKHHASCVSSVWEQPVFFAGWTGAGTDLRKRCCSAIVWKVTGLRWI